MTGVTATLSALNASVKSISAGTAAYSALGKNETRCNITPFVFTLSDNYDGKSSIELNLRVKNGSGRIWDFKYDITHVCNQMPLSSISAYSENQAIKLCWNSVRGNRRGMAVGYDVYRSENGVDGVYTLQTPIPVSSLFYVDTDVAPGKTYFYKVAGMVQSGHWGALSDPVAARSCYPLAGQFPRSPEYAAGRVSSVNVCDIDGDGMKELFAGNGESFQGGGHLIGLDSRGDELIDNDPGYLQGIARLPAAIPGIPAIGDIKGDGEQCVVLSTWGASPAESNVVRCYSVSDKNKDGQADLVWENRLGESVLRGVVLSNLDGSPDGTMETVVRSVQDSGIMVLDSQGNVKYSFGQGKTLSMVAVADLDGDGRKEIIAAYDTVQVNGVAQKGGLYIWRYTGEPFSPSVPFFPGVEFSSSPVVCDIDGDGRKEILISQKREGVNRIYAIDLQGALLPGWDKGEQSVNYSCSDKKNGYDHMLSVGDIDGDGSPEVVCVGRDAVMVWRGDGSLVLKRSRSSMLWTTGYCVDKTVPILADVDGDGIADIVYPELDKINAIRGTDGSAVLGFPLYANSGINGNLCVADIDRDGKSEIVCADADSHVYVWKTNGATAAIEWGSERHDAQNTGEYGRVCEPVYVNSSSSWNGIMPCGNLILNSGKFTVPAGRNLSLGSTSKIIVRPGAVLEVDGGTVSNAYVRVLPGGNLTLKNGGRILLRSGGKVAVDLGAALSNQNGKIE